MLKLLRHSIYTKILFGLMGLHFLNISVDAPDPFPEHIPEDLSFNDQESIVEIVIEKILGYENAIEEYDDHDKEDHTKKSNSKIDLIALHFNNSDHKPSFLEVTKQKFPEYNSRITNGFQKLITPPPKV